MSRTIAPGRLVTHADYVDPNSHPKKPTAGTNSGATVRFEAQLWAAADALRNNMDAAEYKHVVLGLIFLKYISDAFEAKHAELEAQRAEGAAAPRLSSWQRS